MKNEYNQPGKNWVEGYVYILDYGDQKTFKIGSTAINPETRLSQITRGLPVLMPRTALVMSVWTQTNCRYLEQLLHMMYDDRHTRGEWFDLNFVDLVEIYALFYRFDRVELYDRWYELVPEDAGLAATKGKLDWINVLPYFTREEEDSFKYFVVPPGQDSDHE